MDKVFKFKRGDIVVITNRLTPNEKIQIINLKLANFNHTYRYEFIDLITSKIHLTGECYNSKYLHDYGTLVGHSKISTEWIKLLYG